MSHIQKLIMRMVIGAFLIGLVGSCADTKPQTVATIEGPVTTGIIDTPLEILGMLSLSTTSGNLPNASDSHFVQATVEVPVGTAIILPALRGWMLGYGSAQPASANPDTEITWQTTDHNWGLGSIVVSVLKIHPPNTLTMTQTAELGIRFYLSDDNRDDDWFGAATYTLLCLGVPGVDPSVWQPPEWRPLVAIGH